MFSVPLFFYLSPSAKFNAGFYLYCWDSTVKLESWIKRGILKVGFYLYRWDPNSQGRILPLPVGSQR